MALSLKGRSGDVNESKWFDFDDETEAKIARWDNDKFSVGLQRFRTVFQEKRNRLIQQADQDGALRFTDEMAQVEEDEQTEFEAQCDLMGRYIVLDMRTKGRDDGKLVLDGEVYQYDADLGEQLLRKNIDFFLWASGKAQELQSEAFSLAEGAEKKPSKSSSGKSNGGRKRSTTRSRSS